LYKPAVAKHYPANDKITQALGCYLAPASTSASQNASLEKGYKNHI